MDETLQFIAALAAGMTAVGYILTKVWKAIAKTVKTVEAINKLVSYELTPNGGGSIKDHTRATASRSSELVEHVAVIDSRLDAVDASLKRHGGRLEGLAERFSMMQLAAHVEAAEARNEAAGRHDRHDEDLDEVLQDLRHDEGDN